jgi:DNA-binding transcriptional LysR family regulator
VELRHLEYFLAVADTRSFTHAAKRLHVVQSGVSATIKALERELGVELFVRSRGGVLLTIAGEELRPRAQTTIDAAHAAREAVTATRGAGGAITGTVSVGILPSINVVDFPAILVKLHSEHPGVAVRLRSASAGTAGLEQQLRDGDLDIALLVFTGVPPADLRARLIATAPFLLVVPAGHPLATREVVTLAELAGFPFVDGPPGYGNRTVVDNAFAAAGVQRSITLEVANIGTAAAHIRNGLGIGFLSQFLLDEIGESGLAKLRISDDELLWRLYIATSATRPLSAATRALLSLMEEIVGDR